MSSAKAAAYKMLSDALASLAAAEEESADAIAVDGFLDRRSCSSLGITACEFDTAVKNGAFAIFAINNKRHVARRIDVINWVLANSANERRRELAERARSKAATKVDALLDEFGIVPPPTKKRKGA